jgi:hypothetical protein
VHAMPDILGSDMHGATHGQGPVRVWILSNGALGTLSLISKEALAALNVFPCGIGWASVLLVVVHIYHQRSVRIDVILENMRGDEAPRKCLQRKSA